MRRIFSAFKEKGMNMSVRKKLVCRYLKNQVAWLIGIKKSGVDHKRPGNMYVCTLNFSFS